jgi:hypothetical protein
MITLSTLFCVRASGDEFSRLLGTPLFELPNRDDARGRLSLTFRDIESLPPVLADARVPLILVKTDQGNLAKLVLSPGFRRAKPGDGAGSLVPIVVVERFETIDASDRKSSKARGKEVTLYSGFELDLDSGQIVPQGLGGDLVFQTEGTPGSRVMVARDAKMITFERPLPAADASPGRPSAGRAIQPADFAGRFLLVANGQWSGPLELVIDSTGAVTGQFRSDKNGTVYAVTGMVAVDNPQKVAFTIQFPRAKQNYEGFLWTAGKDVIAGTFTLLERTYGFVAIREGASLLPEDLEVTVGGELKARAPATNKSLMFKLGLAADSLQLDGAPVHDEADLTHRIRERIKSEPGLDASLTVADRVPFERVRAAVTAIKLSGIKTIHIIADPNPNPNAGPELKP